jgi:hypothetical protein
MKYKLLSILLLFGMGFNYPKAQVKIANSKDSSYTSLKNLKSLINMLRETKKPLYTTFDSVTIAKVVSDYQPIIKKFYSKYLLIYSLERQGSFANSTTQSIQFYNSILLYNNAQYLDYIPSSLIQIDFADKIEVENFLQHPLGKYCRKALIISLKKGNEKKEFYLVF